MIGGAGKLRKYRHFALPIAGAQTADDWCWLADGDVTPRIEIGGMRRIRLWLRERLSNKQQRQNQRKQHRRDSRPPAAAEMSGRSRLGFFEK
jgi:hypothetical protein